MQLPNNEQLVEKDRFNFTSENWKAVRESSRGNKGSTHHGHRSPQLLMTTMNILPLKRYLLSHTMERDLGRIDAFTFSGHFSTRWLGR